jgi:hypothetical protein
MAGRVDGWVEGRESPMTRESKIGEMGGQAVWMEKTNLVQSLHDYRKNVCPHETLSRLLFVLFDYGRFVTVVLYYCYFLMRVCILQIRIR